MQHRAFAPALGALAAIFVAAGVPSYASAADPSGIWAKEDGSAKMEVKKCGRGICSKIVWLKNPEDSRGRPLRDARNENTSMRDRPIIGLPLFINMVAIDSSSWQGSVYNPEEGKVYNDVKVTLASHNQIVLKGCKAWLLCGEKVWIRSKLLPSVVKPEEQEPIEVKEPVVPEEPAPKAMPKPAPVIEAAREPVPEAKPGAMAPHDGRNAARGCARPGEGLGCPEEDGEIDFAEQCPETQPCGSRPCYHLDHSRSAAALWRQRVKPHRDDKSRRRDAGERARGCRDERPLRAHRRE